MSNWQILEPFLIFFGVIMIMIYSVLFAPELSNLLHRIIKFTLKFFWAVVRSK